MYLLHLRYNVTKAVQIFHNLQFFIIIISTGDGFLEILNTLVVFTFISIP
jgi:hypothetical protein